MKKNIRYIKNKEKSKIKEMAKILKKVKRKPDFKDFVKLEKSVALSEKKINQ